MSRGKQLVALAVVLAAFGIGLAMLFRWRLQRGDVFPAYSSLRADPLGLRALYEALAELPGLQVGRRTRPLETLPAAPARTILLAGLSAQKWARFTMDEFEALDAAVRGGSRLVIALHAAARADEAGKETDHDAGRKMGGKKSPPRIAYADPDHRWGVELTVRELAGMEGAGARRVAAAELPARVTWRSEIVFRPEPDAGWRVLYQRGGRPVLIERQRGRGTIVLAGDAYFLSNEALQRDRSTSLLAWLIGPNQSVLFDESHLGVVVQPGIVALARRYGLLGTGLSLLLLAALFVWQRMTVFVPPAEEPPGITLSYHPAAGLEALLRRAVPGNELMTVCTAEWILTARAGDVACVEAVLAAERPRATVTAYNAATRALRRRPDGRRNSFGSPPGA